MLPKKSIGEDFRFGHYKSCISSFMEVQELVKVVVRSLAKLLLSSKCSIAYKQQIVTMYSHRYMGP
jgi:hypothetical protein